ncbi:uncharacterized protein [Mobula birostris]|uniref:uncharacterized protein n=1 Tax=Mobula birostris TaxID=1983395 RepID=UPI003B280183
MLEAGLLDITKVLVNTGSPWLTNAQLTYILELPASSATPWTNGEYLAAVTRIARLLRHPLDKWEYLAAVTRIARLLRHPLDKWEYLAAVTRIARLLRHSLDTWEYLAAVTRIARLLRHPLDKWEYLAAVTRIARLLRHPLDKWEYLAAGTRIARLLRHPLDKWEYLAAASCPPPPPPPGHMGIPGSSYAADDESLGLPAPEEPPMLKLILLQNADGSWTPDPGLELLLGLSLGQVREGLPLKDMDLTLWTTILAVIWLNAFAADSKDEWDLLVKKALSWVKARAGADLMECVKAGNRLLKTSVLPETLGL